MSAMVEKFILTLSGGRFIDNVNGNEEVGRRNFMAKYIVACSKGFTAVFFAIEAERKLHGESTAKTRKRKRPQVNSGSNDDDC